jgi:hypothetical protein
VIGKLLLGGLLPAAGVAGVGVQLPELKRDLEIVTRSEHIPRIHEAQASAYHVLPEPVA